MAASTLDRKVLKGSLASLLLLLLELWHESVELVPEVEVLDDVDDVLLVEDVLPEDEVELSCDGAFFSISLR